MSPGRAFDSTSSLIDHTTATVSAVIASFFQTIFTHISTNPVQTISSGVWIYFAGTFLFDAVHWFLHWASKQQNRFLRSLGDMHLVHHLYFNRRLKFNEKYHWHNLTVEIPIELACQLIGSWVGWAAVKHFGSGTIPNQLLYLILIIQIVRVAIVLAEGGKDSNHKSFYPIPDDPNFLIIGPEYHALHHCFPDRYMSSALKVFDWTFGLASNLRTKRIAITGANGAFGRAIKRQLLVEGVSSINDLKFGSEWTHEDFTAAIPILRNADVLILAHGSKGLDAVQANTHSTITLVNLFRKHRQARPTFDMDCPEIWYTGSEIEIHPAWGIPELQRYSKSKRDFLPTAKALYQDPTILYRHVVLASFSSPMGPAIVSADWAAKWTMWWIRRGARYIPVTYTGLALLNYVKFAWFLRPADLEKIETRALPGEIDKSK